jgi:hypothetical protein
MHMHAIPCDGPLQKALIRKLAFVVQCWWEAGLTEIFSEHKHRLVVFFCFLAFSVWIIRLCRPEGHHAG